MTKTKKNSPYTLFSSLAKTVDSIKKEGIIIRQLHELSSTGIPVSLDKLAVTPTGIYTILEEDIIKKVAIYTPVSEEDKDPRYHIFLCDSLKEQVSVSGVASREDYRMIRRKDEKFHLKIIKKFKNTYFEDRKLNICMFCLKRLNSVIEGENELSAEDFNLADFIKNQDYFGKENIFNYDYDHIPSSYEKSWQTIADLAKLKTGYKCKVCSFKCLDRSHIKYLQTHYYNDVFLGNRIDRVKPICIRCHAELDGHEEIKKTPDYKNFLMLLQSLENTQKKQKSGN